MSISSAFENVNTGSLTQGTPRASGRQTETIGALLSAGQAQQWKDYDQAFADWEARGRDPLVGFGRLFGLDPAPATPAGERPNLTPEAYQNLGREALDAMRFENSVFNVGPLRDAREEALKRSMMTDVEGARATQDQNLANLFEIAKASTASHDKNIQDAFNTLNEAYGGSIGARKAEIDRAVNRGLDLTSRSQDETRLVADKAYADVQNLYRQTLAKFDEMTSTTLSLGKEAINDYRVNIAQQVETQTRGIDRAAAQGAQEIVAAHQRMGYGLDDPRTQAALFEHTNQAASTIADIAGKTWSEFHKTKAEMGQQLAALHGSLTAARGTTAVAGMGVVAQAGAARAEVYRQSYADIARIQADLIMAGESEKTAAIQNYIASDAAIRALKFAGDTTGSELLAHATTRQWIPESASIAAIVNYYTAQEAGDIANIFSAIKAVIGVGDFLYTISGGGQSSGGGGGSSGAEWASIGTSTIGNTGLLLSGIGSLGTPGGGSGGGT